MQIALRRLLVCVLPLALGGCPATSSMINHQPFVQDGEAMRHEFSGASFPATAGPFSRVNTLQYDAAGKDMSAGYDDLDPSHPVIATIYVYPAPPLLAISSPADVVGDARAHLTQDEFKRREHEIEAMPTYSNVVRVSEHTVTNGFGSAIVQGWHADYRLAMSIGGNRVAAISELEVYCFVAFQWCVEYRVSEPAATANGSDPLAKLQAVLPLLLSGTAHDSL